MAANTDVPVQLQPNSNDSDKTALINENFRKLSDSLNPFQLSDGTTNRLLLGKDSDGDYVLKIADEGYDAYDADDANLTFNSSQNTFKIVATGNIPFTIPSGTPSTFVTNRTYSVSHSLGYPPMVLGAILIDPLSINAVLPYQTMGTNASLGGLGAVRFSAQIETSINAITLVFNYYLNGSGDPDVTSGTVRYYILQETAL